MRIKQSITSDPFGTATRLAEGTRFLPEAFWFVYQGLEDAHDLAYDAGRGGAESRPHVAGWELCWVLRKFAVRSFGSQARKTIEAWNIRSCDDIAVIVFRMAELGAIQIDGSESPADFQGLFSFDEAFTNLAKETPGAGPVFVSMAEYQRISEQGELQVRMVDEPSEPEAWRCPTCGRKMSGRFFKCWHCGTTYDGVPDPPFRHRVERNEARYAKRLAGDRFRLRFSLRTALILIACCAALIALARHKWLTWRSERYLALARSQQLDGDAVPALVSALNGTNAQRQVLALATLQELGEKGASAVPALLALRDVADESVRDDARYAVSRIGHAAVPALAEILRNPAESESGRIWSVQALCAVEPSAREAVVPLLNDALYDPSYMVRLHIAVGLRPFGPAAESAIPRLIELLSQPGQRADEQLEQSVVAILVGVGKNAADLITQQLLVSSDARLRQIGVTAFGAIFQSDPDIALPVLIPMLQDGESNVSVAAAYALSLLGDSARAASAALIEACAAPDHELRRTSLRTLTHVAPDDATVVKMLLDAVHCTCCADTAFSGLHNAAQSNACARQQLLELAENTDNLIRRAAIRSIGQASPQLPGSLDVLLSAAKDQDSSVRAEAVIGLRFHAMSRNPQAIEAIRAARMDNDLRVRRAALKMLPWITHSSSQ
jgi:uncharacterized repeat protein (TIGR04138 family)